MDSSFTGLASSIAELEFDESDFLMGEEFRITILGPRKAGKTSLVNKLVNYPLIKPSLVESTKCIFRTHFCKYNGVRILDLEQTAIQNKSFTSKEEMKEFLTTQEGSIQNFSAVDIFVETEELQRVWCLTELPESVFDAQWYPSFSTDVLIVIVGISDICLTHPEKLKNMLSACHQKLVNSETRKTYFVTNKWDTLDDDDKRESIKIMQSFKTMLSECWPDPITEEHLFCTSLSKTTTFVQDMEKLKKEIQDTATSFFHFSADEAMEKTMSITQYLLKLFQNEEFQEHFKKELPNLPDIIVRKQKEIKSTEAIVVVAGDTSAGKTSFINKLLRRQIFEPRTLASTACVCRIRKSKVEKIEFYTTENDFLCSVDIEGPTMLFEKLRSYTELDKKKQINGKDIHYVDIYMSSETLQNHMVLVDTPGIGFKKSLDEILFDYLPNASCFIFVVDAANAGGFRENRLLRILKVVVDKQAEMPFFDIKDVIFLTNKWDNIDSEDDSSDEDEEFLSTEETHGGSDKEKTFSHILDTLYREWSTLSKENVYKVCLKQNEGEYEDDFRRFERKLLGVVEKTKNRLMFDHLRVIVDAFEQIERNVCAHKRNNEDLAEYIEKVKEFLPEFQRLCTDGKQLLQSNITSAVLVFASKIYSYLHSTNARAGILAKVRPGVTTIFALKNEIVCLLTNAIQDLMEGEKIEGMLQAIDKKIRDYTRTIEKRAQQMEGEIFQINMPFYAGLNEYNANISSVFMTLVPCTLSFTLVDCVPINFEKTHAAAEFVYDLLLEKITLKDIETCLDMSITKKYRRVIDKIHSLYIKKEESLNEILSHTSPERESMKGHVQLYENLIKELGNIRMLLRPLILNMRRNDCM